MASNPVTASERRGILIVAIIALLLCGGGLFVSRCGGEGGGSGSVEADVLYDPKAVSGSETADSAGSGASGFIDGNKTWRSKRSKQDKQGSSAKRKTKKQRQQKTYRRRSPIDEEV